MATYKDLGEWALATLKATAAVTDLVYAGASAVLESGDVSNTDLEGWQKARRDAGQTSKVLAVFIMDTGETQARTSSCYVFIYDRGSTYANIRTVREAVIETLKGEPVSLVRSSFVVSVDYQSRTGHAIDRDFDLDFERIVFSGPVLATEPDQYA